MRVSLRLSASTDTLPRTALLPLLLRGRPIPGTAGGARLS